MKRKDPNEYRGSFIIESQSGDVYAADRIRVGAQGVKIFLGPIQTGTISAEEIHAIHQLEDTDSLDLAIEHSKIAATFLVLESLIEDYCKSKEIASNLFTQHHASCIVGSRSLALTLLPERTSEDIDLIGPEDFVDFVNNAATPYTELSVEVLPPAINQMLGNWQGRTTKMHGYKGTGFLVMHPLDTIAQKLLRLSEEKFETKDKPDIVELVKRLEPPLQTLKFILTENALRYYPSPLGKDEQNLAVERNTKWFCDQFLDCSYEDLVQEAIGRLRNTTDRIGKVDKIQVLPEFKLQNKIKLHKKKPDDFRIS